MACSERHYVDKVGDEKMKMMKTTNKETRVYPFYIKQSNGVLK